MSQRHWLAIACAAGVAFAGYGRAQQSEKGLASWYGPSFDGLRAASGETYDSGQLTAAHRTLPFGTKVRVRRLDSQESIVVRINDRGPYVESRIIDLSYAAARQLGATDPGVIPVTIDVVEDAESISARPALFVVQAGSFRDPDNARRTRDMMIQRFGAATVDHSGVLWRVLVGNASPAAAAETLAKAVRQSEQTYQSAFVVPAGR